MMKELDLERLIGKADRDMLVHGMQALHEQRVAAWKSQNAYARSTGQVVLDQAAFGIDAAASMLQRLGAAPSSL